MSATVSDLLAEPSLALRLLTPEGGLPDPDASAVFAAATELADPSPYLSGGEVVLTTGLRLTSQRAQRGFVRSIAAKGAAALGFGTGGPGTQLPCETVPPAVLDEAQRLGLPVFEVPEATPFVAVGTFISGRNAEARAAALGDLLEAHRRLASALVSGGRNHGINALLSVLAEITGGPLEIHRHGRLLHRTPHPAVRAEDWSVHTIPTGFMDRAALWSLPSPNAPAHASAAVDYACSLLGVELANASRSLLHERQSAGRTLHPLLAGTASAAESQAGLRSLGIDDGAHRCVVVLCPAAQRRTLAALPLAAESEARAVWVEELLLVIQPAERGAQALAKTLSAAGIAARIGVSRPHAPSALRWAWQEALGAARQAQPGQAVVAERLTMASLLASGHGAASGQSAAAELAEETLRPLLRDPSPLLQTLREYIRRDGAVQDVAEALGVHRNSVRYRLETIERLTGHHPASIEGITHLNLALKAWDLAHPEDVQDGAGPARVG